MKNERDTSLQSIKLKWDEIKVLRQQINKIPELEGLIQETKEKANEEIKAKKDEIEILKVKNNKLDEILKEKLKKLDEFENQLNDLGKEKDQFPILMKQKT